MKIAIIGSGMAGLTAGAYLAQAGHDVSLFEQYGQLGGVTASYEQHGYKWDLGQLLIEGLGPDEPMGQILTELGVADRIQVIKDDRTYVFPDFSLKKPAEYTGILWRMQLLKKLFPGEEYNLDRYWNDYLRFTRLMTFARRMERASGLRAFYERVRLYLTLLPFLPKKNWSAQRLMDNYFHSDKLKAIFISILADFFTPPSQFIGLGVFALNSEGSFESRMAKTLAKNAEQVFHYTILGGVSSLVNALVEKIRSSGGHVYTSRPVVKILIENNRVTGVMDADGKQTAADTVIASGAAKETFMNLVGEQYLPAEFIAMVHTLPLMDSVFMLHLGLDIDPTPYVYGVCTYYYGTYDIEGGVEKARQGIYHEGQDGFVVHAPTLRSAERAPAGKHAITIYTICPDRLKDGTWSEQKNSLADKLIDFAEKRIPNLREHICEQVIMTPEDFRVRTASDHHAFGGLAPYLGFSGIPHQTPINGLWFIGAQSVSGGGVAAVVTAAYKTAHKVAQGR